MEIRVGGRCTSMTVKGALRTVCGEYATEQCGGILGQGEVGRQEGCETGWGKTGRRAVQAQEGPGTVKETSMDPNPPP